MTPLNRRIAAVSAPVLLALSLTACGGGTSGAPDDASTEDFCGVFTEVAEVEDGADIQKFGENLAEVGTPEDMSGDERAGFEVFVDALSEVDEDASADDIEDPDLSGEDEKKFDAFIAFTTETCAEELQGDVEVPEVPSELPS